MSNILPRNVSQTVKSKICAAADEAKYASMSRPDSGAFMDMLVKRADIGGLIEQHIPKAEVKTYIKDGVLNAYSKAHARKSKPQNLQELIMQHYSLDAAFIEKAGDVEIFAANDNGKIQYVLISSGTLVKWETALRKLLLCVASKPLGEHPENSQLFIILMAQGKSIAPADKSILQKALARCGAKACIVGE